MSETANVRTYHLENTPETLEKLKSSLNEHYRSHHTSLTGKRLWLDGKVVSVKEVTRNQVRIIEAVIDLGSAEAIAKVEKENNPS